MIRTIVVGVDGSDGARGALVWAGLRAGELGAEVVAVLVVRPFGEFVLQLPPLPGDLLRRLRRTLDESWCQPLRDAGVKHRSVLVEGDPAVGLVEVADREHADMLVLGANEHSGLGRILGSVTYKVAHRAHCPVVIVPAPDTSADGSRSASPQ
jgi:nucleotide-binding universal stress UspA family protein